MVSRGITIQTAFERLLKAALTTTGKYNYFVQHATLPKADLDELELPYEGGNMIDENRLDEIFQAIAAQFFQSPEQLETWLRELARFYGKEEPVKDALNFLNKELAKPSLWTISDWTDDASFVFDIEFLRMTIANELRSRYRLDVYTPPGIRESKITDVFDSADFDSAGCIVISRSNGARSLAQDLISNIIARARKRSQSERNETLPRIVFTASSRELALELKTDVTKEWNGKDTSPPFLFLIPSNDGAEIDEQRLNAESFFARTAPPPPPPPENDLVILVGGKLTTDGDGLRFSDFKKLLGEHKSLVIIDPWKDETRTLDWHPELEIELGRAKSPLLIEHLGENDSAHDVDIFSDYLMRAVASRPGGGKLALVESIVERASKQRLIWKPAGPVPDITHGPELVAQSPEELAQLIRDRLGLSDQQSRASAYVAVEEIVIDNKLDGRLRKALKKHLSIIAGGDGFPPSTDWVVPFSFQIAETGDPLHKAIEKFRRSRPNIVAACDVSRGGRPLKQYLTEISARISDGLNSYFLDKSDRRPECILRIVVMIADLDQQDSEVIDNANGSWRVVKFLRRPDEYVPWGVDVEMAKAWVNAELAEAHTDASHAAHGRT